jgi:hypothetical protein
MMAVIRPELSSMSAIDAITRSTFLSPDGAFLEAASARPSASRVESGRPAHSFFSATLARRLSD